jgi:hypothetical protein
MRCADARDAFLVADVDELRGAGDSELAEHVRTCAECRAAAQQILAVTAGIAARLDQVAIPRRSRWVRSAWPVWMALPIAAALSGLMLTREPGTHTPPPRVGALEDVKQPVVHPVVNAPPGRNVAVIEAANNITVVWDLGAKGGS